MQTLSSMANIRWVRLWNGYNAIEDVYRSRNLLFTWTKDYEDQVMGLQFSLWTERVADEKRLTL